MSELAKQLVGLNFSWVEEDAVAGCRGPRTDVDLGALRLAGVRALVRLAAEAESGLSRAAVRRSKLEDYYEPVPDFTAPSQQQLDGIVRFIHYAIANRRAVTVSCGAGYGRTGTALACYLVSKGLSAESAIEKLIIRRPCSDEILTVPGQKEAIFRFYERLAGSHGSGFVPWAL